MTEKSVKKMLVIEDNVGDARLLREMLHEGGSNDIELTHVDCMRDAEVHLAKQSVDIILLDLGLSDAQGMEAVRRARAAAPGVVLVVMTGLDDEAVASQALQGGRCHVPRKAARSPELHVFHDRYARRSRAGESRKGRDAPRSVCSRIGRRINAGSPRELQPRGRRTGSLELAEIARKV